jgi:hypothetical protein
MSTKYQEADRFNLISRKCIGSSLLSREKAQINDVNKGLSVTLNKVSREYIFLLLQLFFFILSKISLQLPFSHEQRVL